MRLLLVIALFAFTPLCSYEFLQKSAERRGATSVLHSISVQAEMGTPWRPAGRGFLLDHAYHELLETKLFCELTARRLLG